MHALLNYEYLNNYRLKLLKTYQKLSIEEKSVTMVNKL